jgi:DNA-directed RNA polymerase specialized sigma24 family protein
MQMGSEIKDILEGYLRAKMEYECLTAVISVADQKKNRCAEKKLKEAKGAAGARLIRTIDCIALVDRDDLRSVLMYQYIMGYSTDEIADKMHYSSRTIQRFKQEGISLLEEKLQAKRENKKQKRD